MFIDSGLNFSIPYPTILFNRRRRISNQMFQQQFFSSSSFLSVCFIIVFLASASTPVNGGNDYSSSSFSSSSSSAEKGEVVLPTKIGKIRGLVETTKQSYKYYAFKGMRYANPPEKELRFKEPVRSSPWEGVLDARVDGSVCPQLHLATNEVFGKEDCLTLNLYTPHLEKLHPVIVFIHGGSFLTGTASSEMYGPDYFIENGIVLVTIQYRLGVLGFLNTGGKEVPGNLGLLDQLLALQWVKENIATFGGDPEQVCLMGEGAGAVSASLLTLTPKARGLFQSIVALSGTALNSQYFQKNPLESAKELASRLECTYEDIKQLVECFRKATAEQLVKEVNNMVSFYSFPKYFAPSIDNNLFSKTPEEILSKGEFIKVPVFTGISRHEGSFYYPLTLNSFNDGKYDGNFIDQRFPRLLPVISEYETKLLPLTKALKKRYFSKIDIDNEEEFRPRYVEFLTDLLFTRFTSRYANILANASVPVFYYVLDYYGSNSIMSVIGDSDIKTITHGDILQYLFANILGEGNELPSDDRKFATTHLIPLIVNFITRTSPASSGQFNYAWPKFTSKDQVAISVTHALLPEPKFRANIIKFWEEEIPKIINGKQEMEKEEL